MSDELKRAAATAALALVEPGSIVGVGTGTTTAYFIAGLAEAGVAGAVASSENTRARLLAALVPVVELDDVGGELGLYVDGADQVDPLLRLVKGAGGAMVREKVLATAASRFVCIVDESKPVPFLTGDRIPVEVIRMARAYVHRELEALGGLAVERSGFTDEGNVVLDVSGLAMTDPEELEIAIESLPGVVGCGIFARRRADLLLVGGAGGVRTVDRLG